MDVSFIIKFRLRKAFLFSTCFLILNIFPTLSQAQVSSDSTQPISSIAFDANKDDTLDYVGQEVKIGGIANTGFPQVHTTRLQSFLQNENYGIPIFTKAMADSFSIGDSLVVKGRLQNYQGLNEIYVESYRVYPEVDRQFTPKTLSEITANPDQFMGMLVRGTGKIVDKGTIKNGKYLAVSINDTTNFEPKIFVSNFHNNFSAFDFNVLSIGDEINFTGSLAEYVDDGGNQHYLVYLRTTADLQYAGIPRYYFYAGAIIVLLIILGAGIWILSLRRKVDSKTEQIRQSLEDKEILLREIHHRVKNNLSIISGLLDFQKDTTEIESTHNALQDSQSRIRSMALIHDKLYQTKSLSDIRLDQYLQELVEAISATFINKQNNVKLNFDLNLSKIDIDRVVPCGLLVNELVVNSFKHAFKHTKDGLLTIELQKCDKKAVLTVADNGPGLPEDFDFGTGDTLGSMLIQTFADQLEADMTIDREHDGAAFLFTFPLN